jgi:amino acid transporter
MAPFGLASVLLFVIPAIVFLLPTALVSAELASGWKGGVFKWVQAAYGDQAGFFAIWQQWMQNVVWYPAQLAFFAAALAYIFSPSLATNGLFVGIVILVTYWISTLLALKGLNTAAWVGSKGMLVGTLIPAAALVVMAIIFVTTGGHSNLQSLGKATNWFPAWAGFASIVLIVSNFLAYAGMEMNAVHVGDMKNPAKGFPKSMILASGLILLIFIPPTLAISVAVPSKGIDLTTGVMQAFDVFFTHLHIPWFTKVLCVFIVIGILAMVVNWIAGPSRGLLLVGEDGFLPRWLHKINKNKVQVNILIVQGGIVSLLALVFALLPSVQSAFWLIVTMAIQLYLIMYMLMFLAAMRLRKKAPDVERGYRVPAMRLVAWTGFFASVLAFLLGFVVPAGQKMNQFFYVGFLLAGILLLGCGPFIFYRFRKPSWNTDQCTESQIVSTEEETPSAGNAEGGMAIILVLLMCGCQGSPAKDPGSSEALRKAELLQEKLEQEGLPVPHIDTITALYGTNGGIAGIYAGSDFQTYYNLVHFGNTGHRPTYLDPKVVAYDEAVLEVYCPEKLAHYRDIVEEWKTEELIPEQ